MFGFVHKCMRQAALLAAGGVLLYDRERYLSSLGIMGYIGKEPKAITVVLEGLEKIPNHGYGAAGVGTLHGNEAKITKYVNTPEHDSLELLRKETPTTHEGSKVGIGHTHIFKSTQKLDAKAHPQSDHNNRISIVHNGSITNVNELLEFIQSKGITPKTNSNTELLAIMIGIFIDEGHPTKIATRLALEKIAGTWAIIVMDKMNPEYLIVSQKGSNMYLGVNEGEFIVSSDKNAITAEKIMSFEDGYVYNLDPRIKQIEALKVKEKLSMISLGDYSHWTIKEIEEQPQSIARAISFGARLTSDSARLKGLEEIKEQFLSVKNLMLIGCGSSFHCCQFGSHIMKSLNLMDTVLPVDPSSSFNSIPTVVPGAIIISESGETREVLDAARKCLASKIPTISIVNTVSSPLATLTGHGVYTNAGMEMAEACTKTFINSCVVLVEVGLWLSYFKHPDNSEKRKKLVDSLIALPMMAGSVIERTKNDVKDLARDLKDEGHMFVLGRGMGESIAYEGASIIKQLSGIHAEGYSGGALKHGPFALIDDGRPIILIILDDEHKELMNLALAEVQARNARTIVITPNEKLITTKDPPYKTIIIEENGPLTGLLAVIPMQLFAYYSSIQREMDPDFPKTSEVFIPIS